MIGWQTKSFLNAHYTSIGIGFLIVSYRLQLPGRALSVWADTVAVCTLQREVSEDSRATSPGRKAAHVLKEKRKQRRQKKSMYFFGQQQTLTLLTLRG